MKVKIAISEPSEVIDPLVTNLASYIAKSKRAIVVTGAGISCSSGIPVCLYFFDASIDSTNPEIRTFALLMVYTILLKNVTPILFYVEKNYLTRRCSVMKRRSSVFIPLWQNFDL